MSRKIRVFATKIAALRISEQAMDRRCARRGCLTPKDQRVTKYIAWPIKHATRDEYALVIEGNRLQDIPAADQAGFEDFTPAKEADWRRQVT